MRESDTNGMGSHGEGGPDLRTAAGLWLTPFGMCGNDATGYGTGGEFAKAVEAWPTPSAMDSIGSRNATSTRPTDSEHHSGTTLTDAALTFPCSRPDPANGKSASMTVASGSSLSIETRPDGSRSLRKGPTSRRRLNPAFVEWLMGWPIGWTGYAAVETASWWSKARSLYESFYVERAAS